MIVIASFNFVNSAASQDNRHFSSNVYKTGFIKVLNTNSDCLSQSKPVELINYCDHNDTDMVMLTEVLPKYSIFQPDESIYRIEGYDLFISNLHQGRGCAIYVKQNLSATKVSFSSDFKESIWCQLSLKTKTNF